MAIDNTTPISRVTNNGVEIPLAKSGGGELYRHHLKIKLQGENTNDWNLILYNNIKDSYNKDSFGKWITEMHITELRCSDEILIKNINSISTLFSGASIDGFNNRAFLKYIRYKLIKDEMNNPILDPMGSTRKEIVSLIDYVIQVQ